MQDCISLQTDNRANTPPLSVFTGQMPFLPPNQQRQSVKALEAKNAKKPLMKKQRKPCCRHTWQLSRQRELLQDIST